ncbi:type VI secretion system ATPase TssH, partial [Candidatus Bathyarchaeota archaeon]|nr:type VI secretion system ATPase TssH [Candidatus Bathyarchaeota archaeon]
MNQMMNLENFTIKVKEALMTAQSMAQRRNHQMIEPAHLLKALVEQSGGITMELLSKLGTKPASIIRSLDQLLAAIPTVTGSGGGNTVVSRELKHVLDQAWKEAEYMKDQYLSTEHVVLAMADDSSLNVNRIFQDHAITKDRIMQALVTIRGSQGVNDPGAEGKYDAIKRYSRNFTELAKRGKLDPVIGRDDEIRRIMHILSRRTKNNPVLIGEAGVGKTAIVEGLA